MQTKKRIRFIALNREIAFFAIGILFGNLILASAISQEIVAEPIPYTSTLTEIERRLEIIEVTFRNAEIDTVLQDLSKLLDDLNQISPSEDEKELIGRIKAVRDRISMVTGALYFYNNMPDYAERHFKELLTLSPSASLDSSIADSKLARYFDKLREETIGVLSVNSVPVESDVYVDGKYYGKTPLLGMDTLAGERLIRVEHKGYLTHEGLAEVKLADETILDINLEKNSGSFWVITSPTGVDVSIDGNLYGTTTGTLAETLELVPALTDSVTAEGKSPEEFSQPLFINYVPLGKHEIKFFKDCTKPQIQPFTIELGEFFIPPIELSPSFATLNVTSHPPDAEVFLDNNSIGRTPLVYESACPGKRKLEVRFNSKSNWYDYIDIPADQNLSVFATPRPTLLFLGCWAPDPETAHMAEQRITRWFQKVEMFNVPPDEITDKIRIRSNVAALIEQLNVAESPETIAWQEILNTLPMVVADTHADLLAAASISTTDQGFDGYLYLIHPRHARPDILRLDAGVPPVDPPENFTQAFENIPSITQMCLGLKLVDHQDGIMIVQIHPDGPAASLAVRQGDILREINNIPVRSLKSLQTILKNSSLSTNLTLGVESATGKNTFHITATELPMIIPLREELFLYNYVLSYLEKMTTFPKIQDATNINIGICELALGNPRRALEEGFNKCHLDASPGISLGTLSFLKSIAQKQLGLNSEAVQNLNIAAAAEEATIIDIDGPKLAPLAESYLHSSNP